MNIKNLLLLLFLQATAALVFPLARMALHYAPPFFIVGVRQLIAGILLLLFVWLFQRDTLKVPKNQRINLLRFGFFTAFITTVLEFWAVQFMISAKAAFLYKFAPIAAVVFSYIHFGEKLTWKKAVGLLLAVGGFLPILMSEAPVEEMVGGIGWLSWPEIAVLAGAVTMVYGWSSLRIAIKSGISPFLANGLGMGLAGILSLILSAFTESWHPIVTNVWPFIGVITAMIISANLIAANLYAFLFRRFTTSFLTLTNFINTFFTAFYGWILLGETVGWEFFAAAGMVMAGLLLFYSEEVRQGYIEVK